MNERNSVATSPAGNVGIVKNIILCFARHLGAVFPLALVIMATTSVAYAGQFAYVTNQGSANVSVIDTATNTVTSTVTVGSLPNGVAITPDGAFAYVTNYGSHNVSVIDTATNTVTTTVTVGTNPIGVAITPDGAFAYVTNQGSHNVSVIDTATNAVTTTVTVGIHPNGVAITPDGAFAYVANLSSANVSVIDTATNAVTTTVTVGTNPVAVAITPDGAFAYVTNLSSANVSVIDTATNTVTSTVTVGSRPIGVAITPDGAFAYVANQTSFNVSVIDTATNTVTTTVTFGINSAVGVAITPDGAFAYVTNLSSATVTVIDTATNTISTTVAVGSGPVRIAFTPLPQVKYRLTDLGSLGSGFSEGNAINASGQVTGRSVTGSDEHAFLWDGSFMEDIGTLGGRRSFGLAISASGQVTGQATTTIGGEDAPYHAFLWDGVVIEDLGTLGGTLSEGTAINNSGHITGFAQTVGNAESHVILWDGSTLRDLGTLGGTYGGGLAINSLAQVTGVAAVVGNADEHAFFWDGSSMRDLGTFGGTRSLGTAINDSGQVTGSAYTAGNAAQHPFLWDGVAMQDLGTLGGTRGEGSAINASGMVTGYSYTAGNAESHVILWDGTEMRDLGTLGGVEGRGFAINASGQVTGYSTAASEAQSAILWDGHALHDLNALIDPADPLQPHVTLDQGKDINDLGQILAQGRDSRTGEIHAYIVSPVTEADSTPPEIESDVTGTLGNGGWYVSNVQVEWDVIDAESAITTSTGCDPTSVSTDTTGVTHTCSATSEGGTSTESVTIKRDATAPTANIVTPANGANYEVGTVVVANYHCQDATAGPRTCIGPVMNGLPINTAAIGPQSFSVDMTDHAANSATATRNYTVTANSAPAFALSTSALTFPTQAINVPSASQDIVLTNSSVVAVPITSIARAGANPGQFSHTHNCGTSVPAGASCSISVIFRPTTTGSKAASLNVNAGAGAGTKTVALSGTGVAPAYTVTPATLDFGNQALNISSEPGLVTLTNTGSIALPITNINDTGTNANQFTETHNCGTSVAAGATCTINVVFRPTTTGAKVASVRVNAGGGAGVQTIGVSGTGIAPAYTLSPTSLSYADQAVGVSSVAQAITLTNTSALVLPITNITRTGTNASQFAHTHDCGSSVAIGASCTINVTFRPTTAGVKVAGLRVNGGAGAGAQTVPLEGTGVVPSYLIAPTTLAFGTQLRNTSSVPQSITVTNTGSVALPISSITLTGANPGQFVRTSNCVSPIAIGSTCTIDVVFRPTSAGAKAANLNVNAGGGGGIQSSALSGTGT